MNRIRQLPFVLRGAKPIVENPNSRDSASFVYDQEQRLNVLEDAEPRPLVSLIMESNTPSVMGLDLTTHVTEAARGEGDRPD